MSLIKNAAINNAARRGKDETKLTEKEHDMRRPESSGESSKKLEWTVDTGGLWWPSSSPTRLVGVREGLRFLFWGLGIRRRDSVEQIEYRGC